MQESNALIDVSIVMPVYNEEKLIRDAILKTHNIMEASEYSYEIIVVDDGSTDRSLKELKKLENIVVIESYAFNRGKGYALRFGAKRANGKRIVFYDSDLNIDPQHILVYLDYALKTNMDVIIGSKRVQGSRSSNSLLRKLLSILYHLFFKVLFDVRVMDSQVGLKLIKRPIIEKILPSLTIDRYAFDVELLLVCSQMNYRIMELPVNLKIDDNESGIDIRAIERMFVDTWRVYYRHTNNKIVRRVFLSKMKELPDDYSNIA